MGLHGNPVYRMLEHTADIRVRISGRSLKNLFQNAAVTLTDLLTDARKVRKKISRKIDLKAENIELLLVRLLQELLFLFDAKKFIVSRLEILRLDDTILTAMAWGERFSADRHPLKTEIKAVTYHGLKVRKVSVRERRIHSARAHHGGGHGGVVRAAAPRFQWIAEVVFDV